LGRSQKKKTNKKQKNKRTKQATLYKFCSTKIFKPKLLFPLCPSKHPTYIPPWNMSEKPKKRKTHNRKSDPKKKNQPTSPKLLPLINKAPETDYHGKKFHGKKKPNHVKQQQQI
jgi:hypothetical protein